MSLLHNAASVLGLNARNIDFISKYNHRTDFRLVDDKLQTKKIIEDAGLPQSQLLATYEWFWKIDNFEKEVLSRYDEFVIKPARGLAGGGILVLKKKRPDVWSASSGREYSVAELKRHISDILYGVYSIDNSTDCAFVEKRLHQHEFFNSIAPEGIADVRVIVFRGMPVMAMCRLPTAQSDGKANVSLGAIGAGIDLHTGIITNAVTKTGPVKIHPDSGKTIIGKTVPGWDVILDISRKVQIHFPLEYMGVDIVIDDNDGPLILELNARPGLEIQNANNTGLREVLLRNIKAGAV